MTAGPPEPSAINDAARHERELLASILDSLPGIYYMCSESRRILRWNKQFESVTEYPAAELLELNPLDLFPLDCRPAIADSVSRVFRDGGCQVETILLTKSGLRIPYRLSGLRAEIGGQRYLLGMGIDLTAARDTHAELQQAGGLLRAISEATSENIFAKDVDGRYLFLNPAAATLMKRAAAEVIGHDDTFLFSPEDAKAVMANDRQVMETNAPQTLEQDLTVDGVARTYLTTKSPYRNENGTVVGVLGIARDISDQIQARQALVARKNLFAMLSQTNRAVSHCTSAAELYHEVCCIASETSQFHIAWIGQARGDRLEVAAVAGDDLSYMNGLVISLDQSDPRSQGPAAQAYLTGEISILNNFMASPLGKPWHESFAHAGLGASAAFPLKERGEVVAVLILYATDPNFYSEEIVEILSEITPSVSFALDRFRQERERAEAQEKLARSQAMLRVASRMARMGAWAVDLGAMKVTWSEELLAILELPADHSPDFEYGIQIYLPAYRDEVLKVFRACAKEGTPFDLEVQASTDTGRMLWVRIIGEAVREPNGTIVGVHGAFEDIGDRKASAELIQLRDRAIQAVAQGILITDPMQPDNPVIFASAGFERITGYAAEDVIGKNCRLLQGVASSREAVASLRECIGAGLVCGVELINYRKDGTPFLNQLQVSPILGPDGTVTHFVGVVTDVTDQRKLEEQLRQVQKMEAIGQLAGGIAHDFNNLLTVINVCSEDVIEQLGVGHPLADLVTEIHAAGERAGTLTRQLLAFSRQQVLNIQVIDLNEVVAKIEKMLRRLIGANVELVTSLSPATCSVRADASQLEQVLMNLSVNARDAMPRGGRLTIQTREIHFDEGDMEAFGDFIAGDYIQLSVTDSGVGMSAETRARIFEPFFTTRGVGQGTGLGLATVHGIVRQSRGQIVVYSEPGLGTTFKIYLPKAGEISPVLKTEQSDQKLPRGTETILLVEDEAGVRALAGRVLRRCGYEVLEAVNGRDALKLLETEHRMIHLLLTDVVMPQMGGLELAQLLAESRPECAVLLISGYADGASIREGVMDAGYAYLQKPFSLASLAQKVRATLDAAAR